MVLDKYIEITDLPFRGKGILVTGKEAKEEKANVVDGQQDYLGYIDIYKNFKVVTYKGKRIKVEE